jgi:predicted MFS family arabinose efflux permease
VPPIQPDDHRETQPAWGAVFAIAFGVIVLTIAQNLPVSLLTVLSRDLGITEGAAGQTITATAAIALVTSLVVAYATQSLDRRAVFVILTVLQVVSNVLVAVAPNFAVLLIGRMLLGVVVGGMWTFAAAVAMRLVPADFVPRALSIIFGGGTIASVVAIPLGSVLGEMLGWRAVFGIVAGLAVIAVVWQYGALPAMPSRSQIRLDTMVLLLRRAPVRYGMLAILVAYGGNFAFFTYLRPFLEGFTQVNVNEFSLIVLGSGIASVLGTLVAGFLISRNLPMTLFVMPTMMSVATAVVIAFGNSMLVAALMIAVLGFAFSIMPVGWSTWVTQTMPDDAESGGGLFIATSQLAITLGAAAGGYAIDTSGPIGVAIVSGFLLVLSLPLTRIGLRNRA